MFRVYFESFLFIHIYIFTKKLNSTSIQEKQSKGNFWNKLTHPQKKIKKLHHAFTLCKNLTRIVIHTTMHKMQTPYIANIRGPRRLTNRSGNSTKHTTTLMCNISNTRPLWTNIHTQIHSTTVKKKEEKDTGSLWK